MPSPSTAPWPRPGNEDEWENMVLDAMRLRWGDPDVRRNGRRGQRQDGVDLFGSPESPSSDARLVAQCKHTEEPSLKELKADLRKTDGFKSPIRKFYFAVSAKRDARLEEDVRKLSTQRQKEGRFPIEVLFYPDVCYDLAGSQELVDKHFPGWPGAFPSRSTNDTERLTELASVLDRPALSDPFSNCNQAHFAQAITDTITALNTGIHRLRDGSTIGRVPRRRDLEGEKAREVLAWIVGALSDLRALHAKLLASGEVKQCGCQREPGTAKPLDDLRERILSAFREIHPPFDVRVRRSPST